MLFERQCLTIHLVHCCEVRMCSPDFEVEAHGDAPAGHRHDRNNCLQHTAIQKLLQILRAAKQATDNKHDQRRNEWTMLWRNNCRYKISPARSSICDQQVWYKELCEINMW